MVENGLNIKEAAKTIAEIKASGSRKTVKGEGIVLLKNWSAGTTNSENPKSKFSGFVANGDEVSFQVWNNLPAYIFLEKEKHVAGETVVRIEYELSRYGMVINKMEPVDGYNPDDFIDYRYDIKVEGDEFSHALKESGATPKAISTISSLLCFKENNDINKRFCREFAALSHHDNCRTGLLAHTTKCLKIYNGIKGAYNFLLDERTNDLMVISLAIHDIGKIYEMHNGTYQEYSFVTHRGLGMEYLVEHRDVIESNYDKEFFYMIYSVIQQHHDEYGEGARTLYALLVHMIDNMDAMGTDKPMTLEEIANLPEFGITRERVRQIEAKAIGKIRCNPKLRRMLENYAA